MSSDRPCGLGFLYPPCGAEDELYRYGEQAAPNINVTLIGTRIFGEDDEHALHHLSRTGQLDNLRRSAAIVGRSTRPSSCGLARAAVSSTVWTTPRLRPER